MQEYKLTKVYKTDKDKNGNQLINKNGKPYTRMSVKVAEHVEEVIKRMGKPEEIFDTEGEKEFV